MTDTTSNGRIDVVIFPNGNREICGRINSVPPVPYSDLLAEVKVFVAQHQGLDKPQKWTGNYSVKGGKLSLIWGDWEGIIEQEPEPLD